jgi:hypothetical protein
MADQVLTPRLHTRQSGYQKKTPKTALYLAMSLVLPTMSQAATYAVTEPTDDGRGVVNTLSWAIWQANTNPGPDVIELQTNVSINGVMKRLIDSDLTLQSDQQNRIIDGNNAHRPLFIKSGQVTIQNLTIRNGLAKGGGAKVDGGRGAGLGGAVFVYGGQVTLSSVLINSSMAQGGDEVFSSFLDGGGGMAGFGNVSGGGLFEGEYGGYGNYQTIDPNFGRGGPGSSSINVAGVPGGFGGGGGAGNYAAGGHGGFGGGGGSSYDYYCYYGPCGYAPGAGGFGAGGAQGGFSEIQVPAGYGGYNKLAAGMGGGLFIRSGQVTLENVGFSNNSALSSSDQAEQSQGLGGAVFVMHTTQNTNGNHQGMPQTLPVVNACGLNFNNNLADTSPDLPLNNDDVFDLAGLITASNGTTITDPCGIPNHEIQITGNGMEILTGDVSPQALDGTDFGSLSTLDNPISQTFMINNLGDFSLVLNNQPAVSLLNNTRGQFMVTQQPADVIGGMQSELFEVTFTPLEGGVDQVTVSIDNNDLDEHPYEFLLQASVTQINPEITVSGNATEILDGDISPDPDDGTDLASAEVNFGSRTQSFQILNTGQAPLNLDGNPVVELLNNSGQFSVSSQPALVSLSEQQQTEFEITFTPTAVGQDQVTVSISSNDPDESPYQFLLEAEGVPASGLLQITGNGVVIPDDDVTPALIDHTYLGYVPVNNATQSRTFTLTNMGSLPLDLSGVQVNSPGNEIALTQDIVDLQLLSGEQTDFVLTLDPVTAGAVNNAQVSILDDNQAVMTSFMTSGYGQPLISINAVSNFIEEGESAVFEVSSDLPPSEPLTFAYLVTGDVDDGDFGGTDPSGSAIITAANQPVLISLETAQDGVYEGLEFFNLALQTPDPRLGLSFPFSASGLIDDDLIFLGGFDLPGVPDLLSEINKLAISSDEVIRCEIHRCVFMNQSIPVDLLAPEGALSTVLWSATQTLINQQPHGDWDADGLPNHHDLNPFGLSQSIINAVMTNGRTGKADE